MPISMIIGTIIGAIIIIISSSIKYSIIIHRREKIMTAIMKYNDSILDDYKMNKNNEKDYYIITCLPEAFERSLSKSLFLPTPIREMVDSYVYKKILPYL